MPALTLLEAAKRTPNRLMQGIALSIVTTDELGAILPFATFQGQSITYLREGTPPTTAFIPDDGTLQAPSSGTDDLVSVPARAIGSDVDVNALADDLSGGRTVGPQVAKKAKATWMLAKDRIVNGGNTTSHAIVQATSPFNAITAMAYGPWLDSNRYGPGGLKYTHAGTLWQFRAPGDPAYGEAVAAAANGTYVLYSFNRSKYIVVTLTVASATQNGETIITFASTNNEFDGLNRIIAPDMVIPSVGATGDTFGFATLDALMATEKVKTNRAFILNSKLELKFLAAHRALGGTHPEHMSLPGYSGRVLSYRGIPVLIDDNILSNEVKGASTTLSSVYLASLDADQGLFMGVPGTGLDTLDIEGDPRRNVVLGWRIESIGALEGSHHRRTRVAWYGALGLRSGKALARAKEIITA